MTTQRRPRSPAWLCACLWLCAACDQFRSLRASNSDEGIVPDTAERPRGWYPDTPPPSGDGDGDGDGDWQWEPSDPPPFFPPSGECSSPRLSCDGWCVDVQRSDDHCGACGQSCASGQHCSGGECVCYGTNQILCDGTCTLPMLGMCGDCGEAEACATEPACEDGEPRVADWPTLGGDLRRSGYNAGERGGPPLSDAWGVSVAAAPLNPVVVAGARVFASARGWYEGRNLVVLDVATGDMLWTKDFGPVSTVGAPTVADCRLYIQHGHSSPESIAARLWSLDANSGEAIWGKPVGSVSSDPLAPMVTGTAVYGVMGSQGGLAGAARANGASLFPPVTIGSFGGWTAAFHDGRVYTLLEGKLRTHDGETGEVLDTIGVKAPRSASTPVLTAEGKVYFVGAPFVYAFELESKKLLWQVGTKASGTPALAEGRLLVIDDGVLTALDATTGATLWSAAETVSLSHPPVAANGFAYAASATHSYAVDLSTGEVVWQAQGGGPLSVGGGHLFAAGSDGILRAYRLTRPSAEEQDSI